MSQKVHSIVQFIRGKISGILLFLMISSVLAVVSLFLFIASRRFPLKVTKVDSTNIESNDNSDLPVTTAVLIKNTANFDEAYDYPPVSQAHGTVRIPILMYHHIAPLPASAKDQPYFVSPTMFDKQMAYLLEKGYISLTPKEFYDQLKSGENPAQKSVMITFDDGNADNYEYAFPILAKYGLTGVFYINSAKSGISISDLREMSNAGMIIDSHSKTHSNLANIDDPAALTSEISGSRYSLQAITGKTVYSIAYPGCAADSQVVSTVSASGYLLGMSCGKTIDHRFSGRFSLSRMHVYNNFENFKQRLSGIWIVTYDYTE